MFEPSGDTDTRLLVGHVFPIGSTRERHCQDLDSREVHELVHMWWDCSCNPKLPVTRLDQASPAMIAISQSQQCRRHAFREKVQYVTLFDDHTRTLTQTKQYHDLPFGRGSSHSITSLRAVSPRIDYQDVCYMTSVPHPSLSYSR